MQIAKRYDPAAVESKWYAHWEERGYFSSQPDDREPYAIVIPPPNVTGVLHMGHMLNNTVQDILIRKARLDGKNACWVPGTDHASIATEAKVVRMLREKGIKKSDLTREEFLKYAWEWREKYGGIILQQLRKLGASCDWERTAFTMDETRSAAVIEVFVDLYRKGKIYRGLRMVNWDPEAKTVLSNEEVLYNDEDTTLSYVTYPVEGTDRTLTVATTRPETILGDTAIAVHPDDERYGDLVGKTAMVPLVNRKIPVIADRYVDREFGTGALKITPAHDPNDYEIGVRHGLEVIDVLNPDGTMSPKAEFFVGEDRDDARKLMVQALQELGQLVKTETYRHAVGRSERTNVIIEPRLSRQWYVDMQSLAEPALKAVLEGEITFFPAKYQNIYRHWMENIRDWCISRQLWWGQRVPAWYLGEGEDEQVFVAPTADEALEMAREATGQASLTAADLRQDEDVVDTWFSSWLWPITVFNGFQDEKDIAYYYPTRVLVTGWDIIFLWVARMIMAGYEWKGERPFDHVYFTGMVRDKQRRKMSKQLGNSPDALKLIQDFGADGVRFGILSSSPAGGDLLFDESMCEQGSKFCNKIWNALRLIKGWQVAKETSEDERTKNGMAVEWFRSLLHQMLSESAERFAQYKLSEGLMSLYSFIWNDFCSWYLEMIKPPYGEAIDAETYEATIAFFEQICVMLHPYMPFITEEVWHSLRERESGDDCMVASYPVAGTVDASILASVAAAQELISKVRELRNDNNIGRNDPVTIHVEGNALGLRDHAALRVLISRLAVVGELEFGGDIPSDATPVMIRKERLFIDLPVTIDPEEERARLTKELDYYKGFVTTVERKLSNERFVQNAPAEIVEKERRKLADGQEKIRILEESLAALAD
ncbi:MAG: valine--tRNA ligase [Saprospiraceae bacterium]|nr:valine--tRNA ligase [Saprospiraceae bacterium]